MSVFSESYDSYSNGTNTETGFRARAFYYANVNGNGAELIAGRFGGNALRVSVPTFSARYTIIVCALGFSASEFSANVAMRRTSGLATSPPSFSLCDDTDPQVGVNVDNFGAIQLLRGNGWGAPTLLWESDNGKVLPGTWHTYSLRGVIDDVNGELHLALDGKHLVSLTGIDTQSTANAIVNSFGQCARTLSTSATGETVDLDDVVVVDDGNAYLPEYRIQTLRPVADGGHLDLTPSTGSDHYAVVDEAAVSTADYLSGSLDGQYDLLDLNDLPVIPASIYGLKGVGFASKSDAATRAWHCGVQSGATSVDGVEMPLTNSVSYGETDVFLVDPNTGLPWTQAGINAAQMKPMVSVP